MKKYFLRIIIIFFLYTLSSIRAQESTPVHTSEHNNVYYDTERFGNEMVDVDLYRGQPNINIPLFNINEKGIDLKVALSYKSGGVKVNTPSQWTGQDWNLNFGRITRTIRGLQHDELDYQNAAYGDSNNFDSSCVFFGPDSPNITYATQQKGFFQTHQFLNSQNWKNQENLKNVIIKTEPSAGSFRIDTEPDIFHFSFFGHSGFFFMGQDGTWKVASKSNLKVIFDKNNDMFYGLEGFKGFWGGTSPATCTIKTIGRFAIVDDRGYRYIFGDNNVKNIEMNLRNIYHNDSSDFVYANSWNIVKVLDPNGLIIYSFENTNGNNLDYYLFNDSKKFINIPSESYVGSSNNTQTYTAYDPAIVRKYQASGIIVLPSYPVSVTSFSGNRIDLLSSTTDNINYNYSGNSLLNDSTPFGSIPNYNNVFSSDDNSGIYSLTLPFPQYSGYKKRKLDFVKLTSSAGKIINDVQLIYANVTQRIFLHSIKNNDKTYTFNYNYPNLLPPLLSNKTDMWGYYNNTPYKLQYVDSSAKTYWSPFENNKFWELPVSIPYLYYGVLTDIYWPTGGKTTLQWESNSFTKRVNPKTGTLTETNLPGGGVRVKKIISAEESREFFYNESFDYMEYNLSSGILVHEPVYYDNSNKAMEILGLWTQNGVNPSYPHNTYTGNIMGINSKSIFEPSDVIYPSVFEKKNDGFIHYTFTSHYDIPDFYYPGILPDNNSLGLTRNDRSLDRGLLKRKDFYNNAQKLFRREDYKYKKLNTLMGRGVSYDLFSTSVTIPSSPPSNYPIPSPCRFCITNASPYEIDYSDNLISEIFTTEIFKDGRNLQYFKKYYYSSPVDASYSLIERIEEYPNKNDLSKFKSVRFKYAVDMDTSEPLIQSMIEKNMVGIPLSTTKYNEEQQPIASTEITFAKNSTTNNWILPISSQNIKTGYNFTTDETISSKITYDLYDAHGRLLQYTDSSGIPTTIIWGYNRSQPIAKIVGATYNYVNANTNIENLQDTSDVDVDTATENIFISLLDDLRKNTAFKDFQITTFTYDPLIGVTSVTGPDGLREYYKYNAQNKLEKVVDVDGNPVEEYKYHFKN